jgi:DNA-binding IclR family transcriptional regulator
MLDVLEAIAAQQPIGMSSLARFLGEDKSAVQRSIVTLANAGWISHTSEPPVRWELGARLFAMAHLPRSSDDLRRRARPILEELRDQTGETSFLAIPDVDRFVTVEVAESRHMLRMVPRVGEIISVSQSATGRALLPYYDSARQEALLGHAPTANERAEFAANRKRGYGVSAGEIMQGATTIAAPIFDAQGQPAAAFVITGPTERLSADRHGSIGALLAAAASTLSRSPSPAG